MICHLPEIVRCLCLFLFAIHDEAISCETIVDIHTFPKITGDRFLRHRTNNEP